MLRQGRPSVDLTPECDPYSCGMTLLLSHLNVWNVNKEFPPLARLKRLCVQGFCNFYYPRSAVSSKVTTLC